MKRIIVPVLLVSSVFIASTTRAQAPVYYGPLMYALQFDTAVPPVHVGQPPAVTTAYLWFDEAMRLNTQAQVLGYIKKMTWNDTAKFIASNLYQIQDDDPMALDNWSGNWVKRGDPYKCEPGRARNSFVDEVKNLVGARTSILLKTDFIADVVVSDTVCAKDPTAYTATDMVLANTSIIDEIKGKNIPACVLYMKASKKGPMPLSGPAHPTWTHSVPADSGSCLEFAYSPEWPSDPNDDAGMTHLTDSVGGWWVKPGKEYIIFLQLIGIGLDSTSGYFTLFPGGFGTMGGMYPVVSGIVIDPHDDFGFGATGLAVADWKSRLRARINAIIYP